MRLVDLSPRWFSPPHLADGVIVYTGVRFDCPCGRLRIPVPFRNALIVRMPEIPGFAWPEDPAGWMRSGETFDSLTLSPSVSGAEGHWHGHIVNGEMQTASPCRLALARPA